MIMLALPHPDIWNEVEEIEALDVVNGLRRLRAAIQQKWSRREHEFLLCRARAPRSYVTTQRMLRAS